MSESLTITAIIKGDKTIKPTTPEGYILDRILESSPPKYVFKKVEKKKGEDKKKCVNCKCHK